MKFLSDSRKIFTHDTDSSQKCTLVHPFLKTVIYFFFLLPFMLFAGCSSNGKHTETISTETETEAVIIDSEETARLQEYLDTLFKDDVSSSTLSMHYSLTHPENYGIDEYKVTLGEISQEVFNQSMSSSENMKAVLGEFKYDSLAKEDQLTIDILNSYADTGLSFFNYYLYDEILKPNTGFQSELPVLLAEYRFNDKQDIMDYLTLLSDIGRYFDEIIQFEMQKSKAGLFMSDFAVDDILKQCSDFCANTEEHYLITTFEKKIDSMEQLTESEREKYKNKNKSLIHNNVLSAYQGLSEALTSLKETGKNNGGLCYLPKGKTYYTNLVHKLTGSSHTVEELEAMTKEQREADLAEISALITENPSLSAEAASFVVDTSDPAACLNQLISAIQTDFPAPVSTDFTINYVDECLQDSMAPAFYLTAPIDDLSHNCIYINPAGGSEGIQLFTTLAHEGFPGHLYQTVMSYDAGLSPIRSLLYYPGYVEGWATYVEMISYSYSGMPENAATLLSRNQSAILSLYATVDMGIHYDGWSLADTLKFFRDYGITDINTVQHIYEYIIEEPAHYLKYYIGYLEFLELKDYAKSIYGEDYSNLKFHQAVLEMGPAPFDLLRKYLDKFYEKLVPKN